MAYLLSNHRNPPYFCLGSDQIQIIIPISNMPYSNNQIEYVQI